MRILIICFVLALIIGVPINSRIKTRIKKIKECIKEKGSISFNQLIEKYSNETLGTIVKKNFTSISKEDIKVFRACRKKIYFFFKKKQMKFKRP